MKNLVKIKQITGLFFFVCTFFCGEIFADNSIFPQVKLFNGTVITAWQGEDNTLQTMEAAIGSISSDPSLWARTTLTTPTDHIALTAPVILSNANGDVVVLYEYYDVTQSVSLVAAAMLPVGETTWIVNQISDANSFANIGDHSGSIDESGNVIAMWSAFNINANETQVMCSTSSISTTPTWDGPTQVSP